MEYFTLSNNAKIPVIGFGPGSMGYVPNKRPEGKKNIFLRAYNKFIGRRLNNRLMRKNYVNAVTSAITNGFRLIDFSAAYGDGKLISEAIKFSGVKRDDLILTTRVSNGAQFNGRVEEEFFAQLKNFRVDYVDILMFHWPVTDYYTKTWLKMIELHDKGYCKILGVANCHAHHLNELEKISGVLPLIDQFEVSPLFTQKELINFCKSKNIQVESYTPLARFDDRLMRLPVLKEIANKYSRTVTQIILRWHVQNGLIPVVRTLSERHQQEDLNIFGFELTSDELAAIDAININARVRYDPDNCDFRIL